MSIMIPSCNAHAYMKFSKKNFAPYAKNATVKNIITINKYNVGMKSLDRAIIVSDTLKTETSPIFISWVWVRVRVRVPVPFPFPAPLPVPNSGFSIRPFVKFDNSCSVFCHMLNIIFLGKEMPTTNRLTFSTIFTAPWSFLVRNGEWNISQVRAILIPKSLFFWFTLSTKLMTAVVFVAW